MKVFAILTSRKRTKAASTSPSIFPILPIENHWSSGDTGYFPSKQTTGFTRITPRKSSLVWKIIIERIRVIDVDMCMSVICVCVRVCVYVCVWVDAGVCARACVCACVHA